MARLRNWCPSIYRWHLCPVSQVTGALLSPQHLSRTLRESTSQTWWIILCAQVCTGLAFTSHSWRRLPNLSSPQYSGTPPFLASPPTKRGSHRVSDLLSGILDLNVFFSRLVTASEIKSRCSKKKHLNCNRHFTYDLHTICGQNEAACSSSTMPPSFITFLT